jgi:hypothetical protein
MEVRAEALIQVEIIAQTMVMAKLQIMFHFLQRIKKCLMIHVSVENQVKIHQINYLKGKEQKENKILRILAIKTHQDSSKKQIQNSLKTLEQNLIARKRMEKN